MELRQIDMGKNDAKLDALERYYWDDGSTKKILSCDKFFIIGRKGTGKTAIAYYLYKKNDYDLIVDVVSLKDIPVKLMQQFEQDDFIGTSRYSALWKFIISIEIAKLIIADQTIDHESSKKLETMIDIVSPNPHSSPQEYLKRTKEFGWQIGISKNHLGSKTISSPEFLNISDFADGLLNLIVKTAKLGNNYHLFIDELDDIYDGSPAYFEMMASLMKTAVDINTKFFRDHKKASVIVVLREDIYDQLEYADKNKWRSDFGLFLNWMPNSSLNWDNQELFHLVNQRFGASIDHVIDPNRNYWKMVFSDEKVNKYQNAYQFILSKTFFRPRDIIQFVKECLDIAIKSNKKKIDREVIFAADLYYSEWFKGEIIDELHPKLRNIAQIFDLFKVMHQPVFSLNDVNNKFVRAGLTSQYDTKEILNLLYNFSIIGQFTDKDSSLPTFRYKNSRILFNHNNRFCMHYALRPSLDMHFKGSQKFIRLKKYNE